MSSRHFTQSAVFVDVSPTVVSWHIVVLEFVYLSVMLEVYELLLLDW
jgi:hypothetical protein